MPNIGPFGYLDPFTPPPADATVSGALASFVKSLQDQRRQAMDMEMKKLEMQKAIQEQKNAQEYHKAISSLAQGIPQPLSTQNQMRPGMNELSAATLAAGAPGFSAAPIQQMASLAKAPMPADELRTRAALATLQYGPSFSKDDALRSLAPTGLTFEQQMEKQEANIQGRENVANIKSRTDLQKTGMVTQNREIIARLNGAIKEKEMQVRREVAQGSWNNSRVLQSMREHTALNVEKARLQGAGENQLRAIKARGEERLAFFEKTNKTLFDQKEKLQKNLIEERKTGRIDEQTFKREMAKTEQSYRLQSQEIAGNIASDLSAQAHAQREEELGDRGSQKIWYDKTGRAYRIKADGSGTEWVTEPPTPEPVYPTQNPGMFGPIQPLASGIGNMPQPTGTEEAPLVPNPQPTTPADNIMRGPLTAAAGTKGGVVKTWDTMPPDAKARVARTVYQTVQAPNVQKGTDNARMYLGSFKTAFDRYSKGIATGEMSDKLWKDFEVISAEYNKIKSPNNALTAHMLSHTAQTVDQFKSQAYAFVGTGEPMPLEMVKEMKDLTESMVDGYEAVMNDKFEEIEALGETWGIPKGQLVTEVQKYHYPPKMPKSPASSRETADHPINQPIPQGWRQGIDKTGKPMVSRDGTHIKIIKD